MFKRKIKFHFEHGISIFKRLNLIDTCKSLEFEDYNDCIYLNTYAKKLGLTYSIVFCDGVTTVNFSRIL